MSDSSTSNFSLARLAIVLSPILLIAIGVEWAVSTLPPGDAIDAKIWAHRETMEEPVDILILGDSSANAGIDEDQLADELGKRVVLFAPPARISVMASAYLLEERLASGARPETIVGIFTPYYMSREVGNAIGRLVKHFGTPRELVWLVDKNILSMKQALSHLPGSVSQAYSRRWEVREALGMELGRMDQRKPAILRNGQVHREKRRPKTREGTQRQGQADGKEAFWSRIESVKHLLDGKHFGVSPFVDEYMRRMLRAAAQFDVPIYLSPSVVVEDVYATEDERAFFDAGAAYLRSLGGAADKADMLIADVVPMKHTEMGNNHVHVNGRGRRRFTRHVAKKLRDREP